MQSISDLSISGKLITDCDFCIFLFLQAIESNNLGTVNNIMKVQKSDFEVFEALALDSSNSKQRGKRFNGIYSVPLIYC